MQATTATGFMPRKKTMAGAAPYTQPLLPGESIILPTKQLQRVFIGLGWNNIQGVTVDLDCSIVAYTADGTRDEENTDDGLGTNRCIVARHLYVVPRVRCNHESRGGL